MSSFYGGKSGVAANITATYSSVAAMNEDFQGKSPKASLGDLVLIDDRVSSTHGNLYRRQVEGAVYVGNIAGKPSPGLNIVAEVFFSDIGDDDTEAKHQSIANKLKQSSYDTNGIVAYGTDYSEKTFYAYNSENAHWYYLGGFSPVPVMIGEIMPTTIPYGSIFLRVEEV